MQITWISHLLMSFIEIGLLFLFGSKILAQYREKRLIWLGIISGTGVLFFMFNTAYFDKVNLLIIASMFFFYLHAFFRGNREKKNMTFVIFYIVLIASEMFATGILHGVNSITLQVKSDLSQIMTIFGYTYAKIISVMLFTIIIYYKNQHKNQGKYRQWLTLTLLFSFSVLIILICVLIGLKPTLEFYHNTALALNTMTVLIFYLLIYFLFYQQLEHDNEKRNLVQLDYEKSIAEAYLAQKIESDERIRILSHDLKHNLAHWQALARRKQMDEILTNVMAYEEELREHELVDVKNPLVNAILNEKIGLAKEQDINLTISGLVFEEVHISDRDLCALMGNLLDNGLEACVKIEDLTKKWIGISFRKDGMQLFIEMKNYFQVTPIKVKNKWLTSKKDKELHGLGMLSIERIVNRYKGVMEVRVDRDLFSVVIMINAYRE